jgi:hypothetical protein
MKGKPWTCEQEKQLRDLVTAKSSIDVIASKLEKSPEAVRKKIERLGLEVVDLKGYRTTTLKLPKELPSIEEALRILAGALKAATEHGLDKVEVQRLQVVATLARTYKELLADYINYREIEQKLIELEAKYAKLAEKKAEGDASKPDSAPVVQSSA